MWNTLANWSWKLGFNYPSLILWGEPKFPMPEKN